VSVPLASAVDDLPVAVAIQPPVAKGDNLMAEHQESLDALVDRAVDKLEASLRAEAIQGLKAVDFCKLWPTAKKVIEAVCSALGGGIVCTLLIAAGDRYYKKHCQAA
jgi:hypothetical protein